MSQRARVVDDCSFRVHLDTCGDSESALCGLLQQLLGTDEHAELSHVSRDACQACCQSFPPSATDINPIVASLLYQACDRIIAQGGISGCDSDQAREWRALAERNLPILRPNEDDVVIDGPFDDLLSTDEPIEALLPLPAVRCGPAVRKWAVGVTTAPRRLPTLEGTLDSLVRAGWKNARLFSDSAVNVPSQFRHFPITLREPRVGAWPNYYLSLAELLMREPDADAFLLVQDDVHFFSRPDLRDYLEQAMWPGETAGIVSLYCASDYTQPRHGWHQFEGAWVWGATAFAFSLQAAQQFVADSQVIAHRWKGSRTGTTGIDILIGEWAESERVPIYFPTPSLVQHTGHVSTLWETSRAVGARRADLFAGDASAIAQSKKSSHPAETHSEQQIDGIRDKLFCIGLNKTGTTSLSKALRILGYRDLHDHTINKQICEALQNDEWHPALDEYDAFLDGPLPQNFRLLKQKFPKATFILTSRDKEAWIQSRTIHVLFNRVFERTEWLEIDTCRWSDEWDHHSEKVDQYFAEDDHFLRYDIRDGWSPLCRFLGLRIPAVAFPVANPGNWRLRRIIESR